MSFWDQFLKAEYREQKEKERAEAEKRRRREELLEKEKAIYSHKLIEQTLLKHGESSVVSYKGLIQSREHDTNVVLTKNRIVFTNCKKKGGEVTDVYVEDIPYREIYEISPAKQLPFNTVIKVLRGNIYQETTVRTQGVRNSEFITQVIVCAGSELGKAYENRRQVSSEYINVCWNCKAGISSESQKRCPKCRMFICSKCGACFCDRELSGRKK